MYEFTKTVEQKFRYILERKTLDTEDKRKNPAGF